MKIGSAEPPTSFATEALSFQPEIKGLLANRKLLKKVEYSDVEKYCLDKHEETLALLLEMGSWIEKNMGLFIGEFSVEQRGHSDYFGYANNVTEVLFCRDSKSNDTRFTIWIDQGLYFWWMMNAKRVVFLSNNIGEGDRDSKICSEDSHKDYKFFPQYDEHNNVPIVGYERFFDPCHETSTIFGRRLNTYEDWAKLKKDVDFDWSLACQTRKCLVDAFHSIVKSEAEYLRKINELKESVKDAIQGE